MSKENAIKIFEEKQIRSTWNEEQEKWYFSIVDVMLILSDQKHYQGARNYCIVLKNRRRK
jgi:hypothetical protein